MKLNTQNTQNYVSKTHNPIDTKLAKNYISDDNEATD